MTHRTPPRGPRRLAWLGLTLALALTACGDSDSPANTSSFSGDGDASGAADTGAQPDTAADATIDSAQPADTATADAPEQDTSPADTNPADADPADADDATPTDTATPDAPEQDTSPEDTSDDTSDDTGDVGSETPPIDPDDYDNGEVVNFAVEAIPEQASRYPLGLQSGGMRGDRALFWTHMDRDVPQTLKVWRESPTPGQVVMVYDAEATSIGDNYFKQEVTGLAPATWYSYAFFAPDLTSRSPVGRVRTAFEPGRLEVITLAATSCTNSFYAPFESLTLMAEADIDLFTQLGDMSYNDDAETLDEYRAVWAETLRDDGYQALLGRAGAYFTWDDHEVTNNWDPETINAGRLNAAKRAYFETLAVDQGPDDRVWASYLWGDTAEFIVLDARGERRPSTRSSDDPIYLGEEQMAWLKERLSTSPAHFKIVLNSVPITNMPILWISEGDRWEGYRQQRQELLDHITLGDIRNVWFLAGDFHTGFISHVEPGGPARRIREIAVGPGGNGPNPLAVGADIGIPSREDVFPANQFVYGASNTEVATTLTFDPFTNTVHARFVDAINGDVLFDGTLSEDD